MWLAYYMFPYFNQLKFYVNKQLLIIKFFVSILSFNKLFSLNFKFVFPAIEIPENGTILLKLT